MKKIKTISFLIAILVFAITLITFSKASNRKVHTVEFHNIPIKTIIPGHNFVGVVWSDGANYCRNIFSVPQNLDALAKGLKDTNIDLIRYPGGLSVKYFHWDVQGKDVSEGMAKYQENDKFIFSFSRNIDDNLDFPSFMEFCKKNGFKAELQVNIQNFFDKKNKKILLFKNYEEDFNHKRIGNTRKIDWTLVESAAKSAARQVKWVEENGYANIVKYWELGNEDYCVETLMSGYTAEEYARIASIFIKEMKAVDPSLKFILTNMVDFCFTNDLNKWSEDILNSPFLSEYKNSVYAVSNHIYGWGETYNKQDFETFRNKVIIGSSDDMTKRLDLHGKMIDGSNMKGVTVFVNEFNQAFMTNPYINSWLGAIGNSEMILSCVNSTYCGHADFHSMMLSWGYNEGRYQNGGFGLLHFAKNFKEPIIKYSQAYAISLLNQTIKGKVLKTDFVKQGIFVSTVKDGENINIILINKGEDRLIKLSPKGFSGLKYVGNKSLGINVPEKFTAITTGDSFSNPKEVRKLNVLNNKIKVTQTDENYSVFAPANTLSIFTFKEGKL